MTRHFTGTILQQRLLISQPLQLAHLTPLVFAFKASLLAIWKWKVFIKQDLIQGQHKVAFVIDIPYIASTYVLAIHEL
jgi:hypothetical protein